VLLNKPRANRSLLPIRNRRVWRWSPLRESLIQYPETIVLLASNRARGNGAKAPPSNPSQGAAVEDQHVANPLISDPD
jgi:hypothetical protein